MAAALRERMGGLATAARDKLLPPLSTVAAGCATAAVLVKERLQVFQPLVHLAARAFHIGFIPMVIMLGMRSEPRPKLIDLITPM